MSRPQGGGEPARKKPRIKMTESVESCCKTQIEILKFPFLWFILPFITMFAHIAGLKWKECTYVLIGIHLNATTPPSQRQTGHLFSHEAIVLRSLQA